jgi:hypothetical protein
MSPSKGFGLDRNAPFTFDNSTNYGIALEHKFNVTTDYPSDCDACQKSGGFCGYRVLYYSFLCYCDDARKTPSTRAGQIGPVTPRFPNIKISFKIRVFNS